MTFLLTIVKFLAVLTAGLVLSLVCLGLFYIIVLIIWGGIKK